MLAALHKDGVIPDTIPASLDFHPTTLLDVTFPNGAKVLLGNTLEKALTVEEPAVAFAVPTDEKDSDATYSIVFLDPDAPSRAAPTYGPARHWLVGP